MSVVVVPVYQLRGFVYCTELSIHFVYLRTMNVKARYAKYVSYMTTHVRRNRKSITLIIDTSY